MQPAHRHLRLLQTSTDTTQRHLQAPFETRRERLVGSAALLCSALLLLLLLHVVIVDSCLFCNVFVNIMTASIDMTHSEFSKQSLLPLPTPTTTELQTSMSQSPSVSASASAPSAANSASTDDHIKRDAHAHEDAITNFKTSDSLINMKQKTDDHVSHMSTETALPHAVRRSPTPNNDTSTKADASVVADLRRTVAALQSRLADMQRNQSPAKQVSASSSSTPLTVAQCTREIDSLFSPDSHLTQTSERVLLLLSPSASRESSRSSVLRCVKSVVRRALGAQVYPTGGYALKTYIEFDTNDDEAGDEEIDCQTEFDGVRETLTVSAFFSRAHEHTWVQRVVNAFCHEAHHHQQLRLNPSTATPVQPLNRSNDDEEATHEFPIAHVNVMFGGNDSQSHASASAASAAAAASTQTIVPSSNSSTASTSSTSNTVAHHSGTFVSTRIGSFTVSIHGNAVSSLAALALFEKMDCLLGRRHLFKRTILLVKAWAMRHDILDATSQFNHRHNKPMHPVTPTHATSGLLSDMLLHTLVLYIFNGQFFHVYDRSANH